MIVEAARSLALVLVVSACGDPAAAPAEPVPEPAVEVEAEEPNVAAPPSREGFEERFGELFEVVGFGERSDVNPSHPQIELEVRARAAGAAVIAVRDPTHSVPTTGFRAVVQASGPRVLPPPAVTALLNVGDTLSILVPIESPPFEWHREEREGFRLGPREVLGPLGEDDVPIGPLAHQLAPVLVNPQRVSRQGSDDWSMVRFEVAAAGSLQLPGFTHRNIEVVEAGAPVTVQVSATLPAQAAGALRVGDTVFIDRSDFGGPDLDAPLSGLEGL